MKYVYRVAQEFRSILRDLIPELILIQKHHIYIQGVPGGKDLTSGECSLGQTIPI
jgi:hypothetical protein